MLTVERERLLSNDTLDTIWEELCQKGIPEQSSDEEKTIDYAVYKALESVPVPLKSPSLYLSLKAKTGDLSILHYFNYILRKGSLRITASFVTSSTLRFGHV